MKPITKRTQCDYSPAFKLQLVDQVEKCEMTYKQAQGWLRLLSKRLSRTN